MSSTAVVILVYYIFFIYPFPIALFLIIWFYVHELQVLKFLMEKNSTNSLHGQVTIGTLILQVSDYTFHQHVVSIVFLEFSNDLELASFSRTVLWVCCLLCFQFLVEILALLRECCQWQKCKERLLEFTSQVVF